MSHFITKTDFVDNIHLFRVHNFVLIYLFEITLPSFHSGYVLLITNYPDNISKKNPFHVPNNCVFAEFSVWARSAYVISIMAFYY